MHAVINMALRAARAAAESLLQGVDRRDRIKLISSDGEDFRTSADLECENTLLYQLQKTYPNDSYVGRLGEAVSGSSDTTWIIDPLIGSRNYFNGYPLFGLSIACKIGASVEHAVLLLPLLGEEFCASRGTGAKLNARRIRVSDHTELDGGLVAVSREHESSPQLFQSLLRKHTHLRCSGSPAIDMVYTSANRLLAGWSDCTTSPSLDAALLILKEAGGLACTETGHPDLHKGKEILYANPRLCKILLNLRQGVADKDQAR